MRNQIPKFAILGLLLIAISGIRSEAQTVRAQGFLKMEIWDGIEGTAVTDFDPGVPPDRTFFTSAFDSTPVFPDASQDNYGGKISGFITVPETGDWWLFLRSDDASELYFNPNGESSDFNDLVFVAEELGCCGAFMEPGDDRTSFDPYALTAGEWYYIEAFWKEGGGGDFLQVAFRNDDDLDTLAADLLPIPTEFIAVDAPEASITITSQDPSGAVTAAENSILTFSVEVETEGTPLVVQWQKNGENIEGGQGLSYSPPPLTAADNGAVFRPIAKVPGAEATGEDITLTVTDDSVAPSMVSAIGSSNFRTITIGWDEPLDRASAETLGNYSAAADGGASLEVTGAALGGDVENILTLTTAKQDFDTVYTVTVNGTTDRSGNAVAAGSTAKIRSFSLVPGKAQYEFYGNVPGNTAQVLLDDPRYIDGNPDTVELLDLMETPTNVGDDYAAVLRTIYTPAEGGEKIFAVAADNQGFLYLSTDDDPANKKKIAEEPDWNPVRAWAATARRPGCDVDDPESEFSECPHRSDQYIETEWEGGNTIVVEAGKGYYMEVAFSEGGGGDNAAVLVVPAGTVLEDGLEPLGGSEIAWFAEGDPIDCCGGGGPVTPGDAGITGISSDGTTITIEGTGDLAGSDTLSGNTADYTKTGDALPASIPIDQAKNQFFIALP